MPSFGTSTVISVLTAWHTSENAKVLAYIVYWLPKGMSIILGSLLIVLTSLDSAVIPFDSMTSWFGLFGWASSSCYLSTKIAVI